MQTLTKFNLEIVGSRTLILQMQRLPDGKAGIYTNQ